MTPLHFQKQQETQKQFYLTKIDVTLLNAPLNCSLCADLECFASFAFTFSFRIFFDVQRRKDK